MFSTRRTSDIRRVQRSWQRAWHRRGEPGHERVRRQRLVKRASHQGPGAPAANTERKALLTIGSGEHAGATIIGQARVHLAPDDALDPRAAIARASVGADHRAQIYLAEASQFVHVYGAGGRPSLRADAAESDVLAYDDPLRTLIGLKNLLKQQHVAGHGADVATMHARAGALLDEAQRGRGVLEREIKQVESYHDRHPGMIAPVRWLAGDIADWLAANRQQGRDHTEDARRLRQAHGELLRLLDDAERATAPDRDQLSDGLMAPIRFVGRTAEGFQEVGGIIVDATVFGVAALGKATGIGTFDYHPISKIGNYPANPPAERCLRLRGAQVPDF